MNNLIGIKHFVGIWWISSLALKTTLTLLHIWYYNCLGAGWEYLEVCQGSEWKPRDSEMYWDRRLFLSSGKPPRKYPSPPLKKKVSMLL